MGIQDSNTQHWNQKLTETGVFITQLLSTDVESFFTTEVREAFVAHPIELDRAAAVALKQSAIEAASEAAAHLSAQLNHAFWLKIPALDPKSTVRDLPQVATALEGVEDRLRTFLEQNNLSAEVTYRLPARFIDGQNLVGLTRTLWKAAQNTAALREAQAQAQAEDRAESRRQLWESL